MTDAPTAEAIAIVGPTASGKTALSLEVARRLGGEIISVDSRQVYRGMDIGTAKATVEQRCAVPHHGLDLAEPDERFSAGRFARYARECMEGIRRRGRLPILVGGTGFFLRALTNPIFREPVLDPERRQGLQRYLEQLPPEVLTRWLARLDPQLAERLAAGGGGGGRQRVLRALEMALLTGRPLSWWHRHAPPEAPALSCRIFVLELPRDVLFRAIDARVDDMLRAGLLQEVRSMRERGYDRGDPGMNATGYAELIPVLDGERSLEEGAELIRRNTRAYARRQITWLRHQLPDGAMWLDATRPPAELADEIGADWARNGERNDPAIPRWDAPRADTNDRRDAE
jgi:tRNA dimethylallyltransferase